VCPLNIDTPYTTTQQDSVCGGLQTGHLLSDSDRAAHFR
jgi:hypothetical protein